MADFTRSFEIQPSDGRTIAGMAFAWEKPARVRDQIGPAYLEEFARSSVSDTPLLPLMRNHKIDQDPIGVASFTPGEHGLMFEGRLSDTQAATETLNLINDGAMRSVSVRFNSLASRMRSTIEGMVTSRTQIRLRELSIVPSGFGQHPDAQITSVRSEDEEAETPRLIAVRNRLLLLEPLTF